MLVWKSLSLPARLFSATAAEEERKAKFCTVQQLSGEGPRGWGPQRPPLVGQPAQQPGRLKTHLLKRVGKINKKMGERSALTHTRTRIQTHPLINNKSAKNYN